MRIQIKRSESRKDQDIEHIMNDEMTSLEIILMCMTIVYLVIGVILGATLL
jgi:hypothetical protein